MNKNTLFILGAGASAPYGFPLVNGLRKYIIENYHNLLNIYFREISDASLSTGQKTITLRESDSFLKHFKLSDTKSIDLFLSRNPNYSYIGKLAIVLSILEKEKKSKFREDCETPDLNWYSYLHNKMTMNITRSEDFNNILDNNFSFITFNYDRSLEKYLYESYFNSFSQLNKEELYNVFNKIPIIHVYGALAELNSLTYGTSIYYHPKNNFINIITPFEFQENKCLTQELQSADRLFFLGFAYAKENMDVLKIKENLKKDCQIFCCCYGMSKIEISEIENRYFSNYSVEFGDWTTDTLNFLKQYLDFKESHSIVTFI